MPLSLVEKRTLLCVARRCLAALPTELDLQQAITGLDMTPELEAPAGVFVSLHRRGNGRLRGCIGWLVARAPLVQSVVFNTLAAATRDPRFAPVQCHEAPDVNIELSVLGPMLEVADLDEIEIGRDGVVVSEGDLRGVLLPQVATRSGWNRETFLQNACRKAALPVDAWRHTAQVQRFVAEVFSEENLDEA